jgi:transposase-like protein
MAKAKNIKVKPKNNPKKAAVNQLSIDQKKAWAQQLYCEDKETQKSIAIKVGISEKTLCQWIEKYNWDRLKKSLLISKQEILTSYYDQLQELKEFVANKTEGSRYADSKEADIMVKITTAIKNLEEETCMADVFEIGKRLINFIQKIDFEKAKEILSYYDLFLADELKKSSY